MKIAIIGGGISGMAAALYFMRTKGITPHIYSPDLGGEYLNGGFKYIHSTLYTKSFLKDLIGVDYTTEKINGTLFYKDDIKQFPSYINLINNGEVIQREYWLKTRGNLDKFDRRCMNDPWNTEYELKVQPKGGIEQMFQNMMSMCNRAHHGKYAIHSGQLENIIKSYDHVIYTIPISILTNMLGIDFKADYKKLKIFRATLNQIAIRDIWWDYMYIPEHMYPFHRVSRVGNFELTHQYDFEVNTSDLKEYHSAVKNTMYMIGYFLENKLDMPNCIKSVEQFDFRMKGQITTDLSLEIRNAIPKNVTLLGRFAEYDKRITFDKVMEKIYVKFEDFRKS